MLAAQQPPPPHLPGPPAGFIAAGVVGVAATVLLIALFVHHAHSIDYVVFPPGWQFNMVLASPLTLDAASVAAAAAIPPVAP